MSESIVFARRGPYPHRPVWIFTHHKWHNHMSKPTATPTIRLVRPAKTQFSLHIRAVYSESSLIACAFYSLRINENLCYTGWMYRLIWVFAGHTDLIVSSVVRWLIFNLNIGAPNLTILGPVVQSVVSLTSSLRVISLTVLADSVHNILVFFAEKMWVAFAHFSIFAYHSV